MKLFGVLFIFVLSGPLVLGQESPVSFGRSISFDSEILGEQRPIWIYTPEFYEFGEEKLPVLYLLDGELHFGHVVAMVEYLSNGMTLPQMIIIGIPNTDRIRDFTPIHSLTGLDGKIDSALFMTSGGGNQFLSFLKDELIPYVDKHYRTQPFRIIEGHSLGGQFATYTLQKEPNLFQAAILISAAFYGANKNTLSLFSERVHQEQLDVHMYLTVGDERRIEPGVTELATILESADYPSKWQLQKYSDEGHISVGHQSIVDGLSFIFDGWRMDMDDPENLPEYEEIHRHFEELSKKLGYTIKPPEQFLAGLGFVYLEMKDYQKAVATFERYVGDYPNSSGAFFCLGLAQVESGLEDQAISSFEKSLEINPMNEGSKAFLEELDH